MNYIKTILLIPAICSILFSYSRAQQPDSTNIDIVVTKMQALLQNVKDQAFDMTYMMEMHDSGAVVLDSLTANCKVDSNRLYITADSTIQIFNPSYAVTINRENKTIYVTHPEFNSKGVMQLDILDSIFQQTYVDSMYIRDSGLNKMIVIAFREQAPFRDYQLLYNPQTIQPMFLKYSVKRGTTQLPSVTYEDYTTIKVTYQNYSVVSLGNADFSTDSYFTRKNGVFIIKSAYSDYTLINDYDNSSVEVEGPLN